MSPRFNARIGAAAATVTLVGATAMAAGGVPVCLHDNGESDDVSGFSNRDGDPGSRRTLLDDFTVPGGETWRLTGLRHLHVWDQADPGAGTGMEIALRSDDGGMPGTVFQSLTITDYSEVATGRMTFLRDEAESWTTIEPVELPAGTYWFEATIVGPENNFWLTAPVQGNECWVNYDDGGGLRSSIELPPIGTPTDLAWCLSGEILAPCPEDLDGNGAVDFGDVLMVLGSWGPCEDPCPPCPEDLDGDCQIAFGEILAILRAWGPCKQGLSDTHSAHPAFPQVPRPDRDRRK